jgi:hypothetical protein
LLFLVEVGLVALGQELDLGFGWLVVVVDMVVVVGSFVVDSLVVGIAVVDTVVAGNFAVDMVAVGNLVAGSFVGIAAVDMVVDRILVVGNLVVACSFVHILGSFGVGRLR